MIRRASRPRSKRHAAADWPVLLVAIDLLALLVALLRLHRKGCDRTSLEPLQRDRLARLLAITVGVILDTLQRRVDLGDQFALPVAGTQLDRAVGLRRGAVGEIGMIDVLLLERLQGDPRFPQDLVLPRQQLGAKIVALAIVHERLFFGGSIILQLFQDQSICKFECPFSESRDPLRHPLTRTSETKGLLTNFKIPALPLHLKFLLGYAATTVGNSNRRRWPGGKKVRPRAPYIVAWCDRQYRPAGGKRRGFPAGSPQARL